MNTYCNVWKVYLELPNHDDHYDDDDKYICPDENDLLVMTNKLKLIYSRNNEFANKLKNGDLIENTACERLGYRSTGVYIIYYSGVIDNLKVHDLASEIDEYGYILEIFADIVLEKSLDYWHNISKLNENVYEIQNYTIITDDWVSFSWHNSYIPIFKNTINTYIEQQNIIPIELTGSNNDIIYILNIIEVNNKKIGIINFKSEDIETTNTLCEYYYVKHNHGYGFEYSIEENWDFFEFNNLVSTYIDINNCILKVEF